MSTPHHLSGATLRWSSSDTSRDFWSAAAVRETFKPDDLLLDWLARHPGAAREEVREAMRAVIELQGIGEEGQDAHGGPALRLPLSARKSMLSKLGVEGSLDALSRLPEQNRTLAERTLADLLMRRPVNVNGDDGLSLRTLKVASEWATAAGALLQNTVEDLERQLERNTFLELLGGSDLHRFVGRSSLRLQLLNAWRSTTGLRWFFIEGPGGIGKSLAVARFIADLLDGEDRPDAVFHFDYDRLQLQTARDVTLLQEMLQQSSPWCPTNSRSDIRELSLQLASRGRVLESLADAPRSSESYNVDRTIHELILLWTRSAATRGVTRIRPRIIVFLDSFEQVEYFDTSAALGSRRLLERFDASLVDIFAICVSRGFAKTPLRYKMRTVRLKQFTVAEADAYLTTEAKRVGLDVAPSDLKKIRSAVGRSPLALRLAVSILEQSGGHMEPSDWVTAARDSPEMVQAALYDRLLRRIRDPQLRKLAVPGLLLRRLTVEVIEQVLAGPCDLSIGPGDGHQLMESARREGQLFSLDPSDPKAIRHRQDVRATMLTNIERAVGDDIVREINLAAVDYYKRQPSLTMRVEELYHRLRLDQDADALDARWLGESGKFLRPVMQEFPKRARAYLRRRMGAAEFSDGSHMSLNLALRPLHLDTKMVQADDQEFRLFSNKELQAGGSTDFILDRWSREGGGLESSLSDVYASALLRDGQHDLLLSLARDVMVKRTKQVPPKIRSAVLSISASLLEGRDSLSEAQSHWIQALAAAEISADKLIQLSALVGCARIRRKTQGDWKARSRDIKRGLRLFKPTFRTLRERHVLAREFAAEFSEILLAEAHDAKSDLQRLIGFLADTNELLPSTTSDSTRYEYLADLLRAPLTIGGFRALGSIAHRMVFGDTAGVERLIVVLRDEVDWGLRRVAAIKN